MRSSETDKDEDLPDVTTPGGQVAYLASLRHRLRYVPATFDIDGGDIDILGTILTSIESRVPDLAAPSGVRESDPDVSYVLGRSWLSKNPHSNSLDPSRLSVQGDYILSVWLKSHIAEFLIWSRRYEVEVVSILPELEQPAFIVAISPRSLNGLRDREMQTRYSDAFSSPGQ